MNKIYVITNTVNKKQYVGKTSKTLEERWKRHCYNSKYFDTHLYRAIRKYGKDSFTIEIIEYVYDENIDKKEMYYIKEYNTFGNEGYNETLGGDGGDTSKSYNYQKNFYDYIKNQPPERFSTYGMKGKKQKKSVKSKISKAHKKIWASYSKEERVNRGKLISGENNGMYGKSPSNSIKIEYNGIIYNSLSEASKNTGISPKSLKKIGKII